VRRLRDVIEEGSEVLNRREKVLYSTYPPAGGNCGNMVALFVNGTVVSYCSYS
jgi:hypothetical protein